MFSLEAVRNKLSRSLIFGTALLVVGFSANAAIVALPGKITRLATGWNGEGIFIALDVPIASPCAGNTQLLYMPITAVQYKEVFAIALAARAQNKVITAYYDSAACIGGYAPTLLGMSDASW